MMSRANTSRSSAAPKLVVHQRHFQAERDRFRVDAVGAPDHGHIFVFLRLFRDDRAQLGYIINKNVHRLHHLHRKRGVDDIG